MSVWRRLSRVGKRAAKFKFVFHVQELQLQAQKGSWTPKGLSVCLTRRNRRYATKPVDWVPTIQNPFSGSIVWAHPEPIEFETTLYRADSRTGATEFEDKKWHLIIEDAEVATGSLSSSSKRNVLAAVEINTKDYAAVDGQTNHATITLQPVSKKVSSARIHFSVSCVCVKEGRATDEDMMSMASVLSMQRRSGSVTPSGTLLSGHHLRPPSYQQHATDGADFSGDVGNLRDFDDENSSASPAGTLSRRQANKQIAALAEQFGLLVEDAANDATTTNFERNSITESRASSNLSSSFNGDRGRDSISAFTNNSSSSAAIDHKNSTSLTEASNSSGAPGDMLSFDAGKTDELSDSAPLLLNNPKLSLPKNDADFDRNLSSSTILNSARQTQQHDSVSNLSPVKKEHAVSSSSTTNATHIAVNNQSEDLLSWAQQATEHYHGVRVLNFTTSWRNGMAFCALIHHFRPDLIAYDSLNANHIEANCGVAFTAAARCGVPRLLDPQDMISRQQPDKLAVMTYVHQLRMFLDNSKRSAAIESSKKHAVIDDAAELHTASDANLNKLHAETAANNERKNSSSSYRYASTLSPVSESGSTKASSPSSLSSTPATSPQHKNNSCSAVKISPMKQNSFSPSKVSPLERTAASASSMPAVLNDADVVRHERARRLVEQQVSSPARKISDGEKSFGSEQPTVPSSSSATPQREDELRARARQMIQAFKHGRYREIQQQMSASSSLNYAKRQNMPSSSTIIPLNMPSSSSSGVVFLNKGNAARSSSSSALLNGESLQMQSSSSTLDSPLHRFRTTNASVRFRHITPPTADGFSRLPSIRRSMRFLSRPATPSATLQRNATLGPMRRGAGGFPIAGRHSHSTERLPTSGNQNGEVEDDADIVLAANISAAVEKLNAELMRSVAEEHEEERNDIASGPQAVQSHHGNSTPRPDEPDDCSRVILPAKNLNASEVFDFTRVNTDAGIHDGATGGEFYTTETAGDSQNSHVKGITASPETSPANDDRHPQRPRRRSSRSSNNSTKFTVEKFDADVDNDDADAFRSNNNSASKSSDFESSSQMSPPISEQSSIERELRELHDEQQTVDRRARLVEQQLRTVYDNNNGTAVAAQNGSAGGDASSIHPPPKPARDDALLTEWFRLVNKKNELIRREMQLRIREKEAELVKKNEKLNQELQQFLNMAESEKTTAQRKREKMLFDELLEIVNERDELVKQTEVQEQAAEEDAIVGRSAVARATEMLANGGNHFSASSGGSASSTLTAALAARVSAFLAQQSQEGSTTTVTTTTRAANSNELIRQAAVAAGVGVEEDDKNCVLM